MRKISDYHRYRRGITDIADTFEHRKPKWELENGFIPEKDEKNSDSAKIADITEESRILLTHFEHRKQKWELENEFIPEKDETNSDRVNIADITEESRISQTHFEHRKRKWELES
ncbi:hypothetical protein INT45_001816 [Circinella minor]|uniref:Uncharacterized protein n=1 Tax=Circinella minor TaxID=1195481 RepID=A0A8H7RTJ2_9FUNG|nr:hypothetical protein INT45_001816 [Circinella minor]